MVAGGRGYGGRRQRDARRRSGDRRQCGCAATGGGAETGGGGAAETVHHEVRTGSASTTVGGEGKAFRSSLLMYIPRTLTTLTLPEV